MKWFERAFESALWHTRLLVLSGVIAGILLAIGAFYMAAVDVVHLLGKLSTYADSTLDTATRTALRSSLVTYLIKAMDNYLVAAILLLFALGLYELFISRMDAAGHRQLMPRQLQVHSLDDLKDRIAKLIILVLVIEFFQHTLELSYTTPQDLLYLSVGVLLISAAFYLSSHHKGSGQAQAEAPHEASHEEHMPRKKRPTR